MSPVLDDDVVEGARSQPAIKQADNTSAALRDWIELFLFVEFICVLKAGLRLWFRGISLLIVFLILIPLDGRFKKDYEQD